MKISGALGRLLLVVGLFFCAMTPVASAASSASVTATVQIRPPKAYLLLTGALQMRPGTQFLQTQSPDSFASNWATSSRGIFSS
jgi:hypothetical protein